MFHWKTLWLLPAFVVAFFAVGIPFWNIPYNQVSVPPSLIGPGLILFMILTFLLVVFEIATLRRIFVAMSLCLPAIVYARMDVETARDPTSHNLWPLEVIGAFLLGAMCILPLLLLGRIAARWVRGDVKGDS